MSKHSVLGVGFIGSAYCRMYPEESHPEARETLSPRHPDVLYSRSTTHNYNVLKPDTLKLDVQTNLLHLLDVLPNVHGTFNHLSSWFVAANAGGHATQPAREDCACDPNGLYSTTKLASELVVRSYTQTAQIGVVPGPGAYRMLRLCNVIGNDPRAGKQKNALEHLLRKVVAGEDIPVYEGDNWRNYLHVDDVCRAIHLCITKGDLNTIYNIGAPQSVRLLDLVEYAIQRTKSTSKVYRVPVPPFHKVVQAPNFWMDTTKVRALGFAPEIDAYQAVERVLEGILKGNVLGAVEALSDCTAQEQDVYGGLALVSPPGCPGRYLIADTEKKPPLYWTDQGWNEHGVVLNREAAVAMRRELVGERSHG